MATPGQNLSEDIRRRVKCFRVLILGRANAGKTTILHKVCNTTEQPEIFDTRGQKASALYLDDGNLGAKSCRGAHNINCEMIFKSNTGFIFHDSCGFEAGGYAELQAVKNFIAQRAREKKLSEQLHVIWCCIPMDNPRPITVTEHSFFSTVGTGKVPVVVVFTKMDALDTKEWMKIKKEMTLPLGDAMDQARKNSLSIAKRIYSEQLCTMKYQPKGSVYMRDMNQDNTQCTDLLQETVSVLDDSNLRHILVSTQQISIEIRINYALKECVISNMHANGERNLSIVI
ncbi:hypothetical protein M422DRAFT_273142 [Sphaerobolus stellatus SS14]|uniref:Unplaced genomic scaffold SPHSTscaffold_320, whole genome shotgun sequence n=1 Tax=Sphaerobolus stellatus (strain SS14) TaxID=990650 RepID=A0A0C9TVM6_SPHS4|nr:hypothetical protein M422DRAFT_273142 [Sphaerobolus stellatus SS14]